MEAKIKIYRWIENRNEFEIKELQELPEIVANGEVLELLFENGQELRIRGGSTDISVIKLWERKLLDTLKVKVLPNSKS